MQHTRQKEQGAGNRDGHARMMLWPASKQAASSQQPTKIFLKKKNDAQNRIRNRYPEHPLDP